MRLRPLADCEWAKCIACGASHRVPHAGAFMCCEEPIVLAPTTPVAPDLDAERDRERDARQRGRLRPHKRRSAPLR